MHFLKVALFLAATSMAKTFVWDCSRSVGTCNNACYAVNHGLAPGSLTYDADRSKRRGRRTASGCNRRPCTNTRYRRFGRSCDEYPFASVNEGGSGAILRCVKPTENSSESS